MWRVKKSNKNVRALARCNEGRASVVGNLSLMDDRSRVLERVPVMNVRGRFGNFVRSEYGNIVSWKITRDAVKRAIEAVTESIME